MVRPISFFPWTSVPGGGPNSCCIFLHFCSDIVTLSSCCLMARADNGMRMTVLPERSLVQTCPVLEFRKCHQLRFPDWMVDGLLAPRTKASDACSLRWIILGYPTTYHNGLALIYCLEISSFPAPKKAHPIR
eukprot:s1869_g4.t1